MLENILLIGMIFTAVSIIKGAVQETRSNENNQNRK